MKKILVESKKTFSSGFNLTEQELRRIVELANEQLDKTGEGTIKENKYVLKYENGVVEETKSLDDVLSLENSGSTKIVNLAFEAKKSHSVLPPKRSPEYNKIRLEFCSSKKDSYDIPIRLNVSGETRDWVFITTSILEERLQKIKTFSISQLTEKSNFKFVSPISLLLFFLGMMYYMMNGIDFNIDKRIQALDSLAIKYQNQDSINVINALFDIHKQQLYNETSPDILKPVFKPIIKIVIYLFIIMIGLQLLILLTKRLYPPYIFNWGDYIEIYKRKKTTRNIIFVVIIVGIIVSVIGGLIANKIG